MFGKRRKRSQQQREKAALVIAKTRLRSATFRKIRLRWRTMGAQVFQVRPATRGV